MKRSCIILIVLGFLVGCFQPTMTTMQKAVEVEAIKSQIEQFVKAYEARDIELALGFISTAEDLLVFGTDQAEVITSRSDFEKQLTDDMQLFESIKSGERKSLSIQISNCGDLASAYYELPFEVTVSGETSTFLLRFAQTFRNEHGDWRIVQSLASSPSTGQSSAELVREMQTSQK